MTTIELRDVSKRFDDFEALKGISLTLRQKRVGVVGCNGSGKSTFARLLNGLVLPTRGSVTIDGQDTAKAGKSIRRKVGFVFQNPDNQIVFPVVEEDVAFGLKGLKVPRADRDVLVDRILSRFGLDGVRQQPAHTLSGGQKQLLAIAGALITEPSCVVFDEPTTLLDLRNARMIARTIQEMEQTVIVVTHDLPLLEDFDRVLVFDKGEVVVDDVPCAALARYVERMR